MAYIKFARNQTSAASEMMIPADGIINIISGSATELIIQYAGFSPDTTPVELLTLTLQVGATGAATLTRANIVEKVIDTIQATGLSGIAAQVPDMEVQTAAWSSAAIDGTP